MALEGLHFGLERFEEAVKCFEKEIELEPNNDISGIYDTTGTYASVLDRFDEPSKAMMLRSDHFLI